MSSFNDINSKFPVRNTTEEKDSFINWLREYTQNSNYKMQVITNGSCKNIVFNDLNKAKIIFTAHYDTPKTSIIPNLMIPNNKFVRLAYGYVPFILLATICVFVALWLSNIIPFGSYQQIAFEVIFLVIYFGTFRLLFGLKKNLHNYNDNTSGISTVIDLVKSLNNDKVGFILFDNEEKGKKGSLFFTKENPVIKENKTIINFDCVGNGNNFIFIATEKLERSPLFKNIKEIYSTIPNNYFFNTKNAESNSDNKNFENSLAVMVTKKTNKGLLYCDRIHTNSDVVIDENNINLLVNKSSELVNSLSTKD